MTKHKNRSSFVGKIKEYPGFHVAKSALIAAGLTPYVIPFVLPLMASDMEKKAAYQYNLKRCAVEIAQDFANTKSPAIKVLQGQTKTTVQFETKTIKIPRLAVNSCANYNKRDGGWARDASIYLGQATALFSLIALGYPASSVGYRRLAANRRRKGKAFLTGKPQQHLTA